jgi:uncharacterized protein YjbI with pentapeptide repeats
MANQSAQANSPWRRLTERVTNWRPSKLQRLISSAILVLLALMILGYWLPIPWIGFDAAVLPKSDKFDFRPMKTLWDWLGLLIVPVVLAAGGLLFSRADRQNDREIAIQRSENEQELTTQRLENQLKIEADRVRDAALREYQDRMSGLLVEQKLSTADKESPTRNIARARTLTVLETLQDDALRKARVVQFLSEAGLIRTQTRRLENDESTDDLNPVVSLRGANLRSANLRSADLTGADLSGADLTGADLGGARLGNAKLAGTNLTGANLVYSSLFEANLAGARLTNADLSLAILRGAYMLHADLSTSNLQYADLCEVDLTNANLIGADLTDADLSGAYLIGAKITPDQLDQVLSLYAATLPDGTKQD